MKHDILIKCCIPADHQLGRRVGSPNMVSFHYCNITNKHTSLGNWVKLYIINMIICMATKLFQNSIFNRFSIPNLDRSFAINCYGRWSGHQVVNGGYRLSPKSFDKPTFENMHFAISNNTLFIRLATPFCCGVSFTVRCLAIPLFLQNSLNSRIELHSVTNTKTLNLLSGLVLNQDFLILKRVKDLALFLQNVHENYPGVIINKCYYIHGTTFRGNLRRAKTSEWM